MKKLKENSNAKKAITVKPVANKINDKAVETQEVKTEKPEKFDWINSPITAMVNNKLHLRWRMTGKHSTVYELQLPDDSTALTAKIDRVNRRGVTMHTELLNGRRVSFTLSPLEWRFS